ncbi:Npun_F0813 family protein [Calothrix sp. 336/3]|uniref:Npun_F0813 family protein n=1 Tax=Calothrix sp. 336/3 TaxID=1337936 RepID=UPI0004E2FC62|nr:Npun_F0813 family protein [Calothrix sp. 336/3]AKG22344.1 hypothetical protein IJ00_14680 [Calothrix sp. 336/3]
MFILKRQDVEISNIQHPSRDQQVPILHYQGQTFRLISVFKASQEEEAKTLWREFTDNRGKACVLLEEPERFSIWGKVRLEQIHGDAESHTNLSTYTQATILLLQSLYMDIEDFLGARQAALFQKEIGEFLQQWQFPQGNSPQAVKNLLAMNPLDEALTPNWQEHHVVTLLQELHRLGKAYFGNTNFANPVKDKLQDMTDAERSLFMAWLHQSTLSKLWH